MRNMDLNVGINVFRKIIRKSGNGDRSLLKTVSEMIRSMLKDGGERQ